MRFSTLNLPLEQFGDEDIERVGGEVFCPWQTSIYACMGVMQQLNYCRGKFLRGEHTLHLWETNKATTFIPLDETPSRKRSKSFLELNWVQFSQILAGPAASNPSPMAIRATVALPDEDIYCPSTTKPFM